MDDAIESFFFFFSLYLPFALSVFRFFLGWNQLLCVLYIYLSGLSGSFG